MLFKFKKLVILKCVPCLTLIAILMSCTPKPQQAAEVNNSETAAVETKRYLYVTAGACYSGNNTTFTNLTSSNQIYRLDLTTGKKDMTVADYFSGPSTNGDTPVSTVNFDNDHIAVLVENTTTPSLRRIEIVDKKDRGTRSTLSNNITALSAQVRHLTKLSSGDFLISKSTAVEFISQNNVRIGAPYINATAAPCATSTTLIPKTLTLSNGKIVFLHAATGQNRFGIFAPTGGTTCSAVQAAPNANSFPSAAFYDSENKRLFVSYSGNATTVDLNSIYTYLIDENTGVISSPQKIYDASDYPATYSYLLYGISDMTYDPTTKTVYIATANSNATTIVNYSIEKFTYDSSQIGVANSRVLNRIGSTPFFPFDNDTKCISHLRVGD
jgi:hypothetical protein